MYWFFTKPHAVRSDGTTAKLAAWRRMLLRDPMYRPVTP